MQTTTPPNKAFREAILLVGILLLVLFVSVLHLKGWLPGTGSSNDERLNTGANDGVLSASDSGATPRPEDSLPGTREPSPTSDRHPQRSDTPEPTPAPRGQDDRGRDRDRSDGGRDPDPRGGPGGGGGGGRRDGGGGSGGGVSQTIPRGLSATLELDPNTRLTTQFPENEDYRVDVDYYDIGQNGERIPVPPRNQYEHGQRVDIGGRVPITPITPAPPRAHDIAAARHILREVPPSAYPQQTKFQFLPHQQIYDAHGRPVPLSTSPIGVRAGGDPVDRRVGMPSEDWVRPQEKVPAEGVPVSPLIVNPFWMRDDLDVRPGGVKAPMALPLIKDGKLVFQNIPHQEERVPVPVSKGKDVKSPSAVKAEEELVREAAKLKAEVQAAEEAEKAKVQAAEEAEKAKVEEKKKELQKTLDEAEKKAAALTEELASNEEATKKKKKKEEVKKGVSFEKTDPAVIEGEKANAALKKKLEQAVKEAEKAKVELAEVEALKEETAEEEEVQEKAKIKEAKNEKEKAKAKKEKEKEKEKEKDKAKAKSTKGMEKKGAKAGGSEDRLTDSGSEYSVIEVDFETGIKRRDKEKRKKKAELTVGKGKGGKDKDLTNVDVVDKDGKKRTLKLEKEKMVSPGATAVSDEEGEALKVKTAKKKEKKKSQQGVEVSDEEEDVETTRKKAEKAKVSRVTKDKGKKATSSSTDDIEARLEALEAGEGGKSAQVKQEERKEAKVTSGKADVSEDDPSRPKTAKSKTGGKARAEREDVAASDSGDEPLDGRGATRTEGAKRTKRVRRANGDIEEVEVFEDDAGPGPTRARGRAAADTGSRATPGTGGRQRRRAAAGGGGGGDDHVDDFYDEPVDSRARNAAQRTQRPARGGVVDDPYRMQDQPGQPQRFRFDPYAMQDQTEEPQQFRNQPNVRPTPPVPHPQESRTAYQRRLREYHEEQAAGNGQEEDRGEALKGGLGDENSKTRLKNSKLGEGKGAKPGQAGGINEADEQIGQEAEGLDDVDDEDAGLTDEQRKAKAKAERLQAEAAGLEAEAEEGASDTSEEERSAKDPREEDTVGGKTKSKGQWGRQRKVRGQDEGDFDAKDNQEDEELARNRTRGYEIKAKPEKERRKTPDWVLSLRQQQEAKEAAEEAEAQKRAEAQSEDEGYGSADELIDVNGKTRTTSPAAVETGPGDVQQAPAVIPAVSDERGAVVLEDDKPADTGYDSVDELLGGDDKTNAKPAPVGTRSSDVQQAPVVMPVVSEDRDADVTKDRRASKVDFSDHPRLEPTRGEFSNPLLRPVTPEGMEAARAERAKVKAWMDQLKAKRLAALQEEKTRVEPVASNTVAEKTVGDALAPSMAKQREEIRSPHEELGEQPFNERNQIDAGLSPRKNKAHVEDQGPFQADGADDGSDEAEERPKAPTRLALEAPPDPVEKISSTGLVGPTAASQRTAQDTATPAPPSRLQLESGSDDSKHSNALGFADVREPRVAEISNRVEEVEDTPEEAKAATERWKAQRDIDMRLRREKAQKPAVEVETAKASKTDWTREGVDETVSGWDDYAAQKVNKPKANELPPEPSEQAVAQLRADNDAALGMDAAIPDSPIDNAPSPVRTAKNDSTVKPDILSSQTDKAGSEKTTRKEQPIDSPVEDEMTRKDPALPPSWRNPESKARWESGMRDKIGDQLVKELKPQIETFTAQRTAINDAKSKTVLNEQDSESARKGMKDDKLKERVEDFKRKRAARDGASGQTEKTGKEAGKTGAGKTGREWDAGDSDAPTDVEDGDGSIVNTLKAADAPPRTKTRLDKTSQLNAIVPDPAGIPVLNAQVDMKGQGKPVDGEGADRVSEEESAAMQAHDRREKAEKEKSAENALEEESAAMQAHDRREKAEKEKSAEKALEEESEAMEAHNRREDREKAGKAQKKAEAMGIPKMAAGQTVEEKTETAKDGQDVDADGEGLVAYHGKRKKKTKKPKLTKEQKKAESQEDKKMRREERRRRKQGVPTEGDAVEPATGDDQPDPAGPRSRKKRPEDQEDLATGKQDPSFADEVGGILLEKTVEAGVGVAADKMFGGEDEDKEGTEEEKEQPAKVEPARAETASTPKAKDLAEETIDDPLRAESSRGKSEDPAVEARRDDQAPEEEVRFGHEAREGERGRRDEEERRHKERERRRRERSERDRDPAAETPDNDAKSSRRPQRADSTSQRAPKASPPKGPGIWNGTAWLVRKIGHVIRHSPLFSFLTLAAVVIWVIGARQLGNLVILSTGSSVVDTSTKRQFDADLEVTTEVATDLLSTKSLSTTGLFFVVNMFIFVSVGLTGLLLSCAVSRADTTRERDPDAWWRHPFRSSRAVLRFTFYRFRRLPRLFRPVLMGARLHGPMTVIRQATWRTCIRLLLFIAQIATIILLLRQCMSAVYLLSTGGTTSFSTLPDVSATSGAISSAAQGYSPTTAFAAIALIIGIIIPALALGLYALLNPSPPRKDGKPGLRNKIRSGGVLTKLLKLIGAVVIMSSFIGVMFFFGEIVGFAATSGIKTPYDINLMAANIILMIFFPPLAWALLVCWDCLKAAQASFGSDGGWGCSGLICIGD